MRKIKGKTIRYYHQQDTTSKFEHNAHYMGCTFYLEDMPTVYLTGRGINFTLLK